MLPIRKMVSWVGISASRHSLICLVGPKTSSLVAFSSYTRSLPHWEREQGMGERLTNTLRGAPCWPLLPVLGPAPGAVEVVPLPGGPGGACCRFQRISLVEESIEVGEGDSSTLREGFFRRKASSIWCIQSDAS